MKIGLIVACCVSAITLLALLVRSRVAPTYSVSARDMSKVINQLKGSGKNGHFAVLIFVPPGSTDGEAVNLQYSTEGGVVGLDWALVAPRNIADQKKVREFASNLGYRLEEHEMNNVHYLRVTDGSISELGTKIVEELYGVAANARLQMITEGFRWKPQ